jgi:hypothetical protein
METARVMTYGAHEQQAHGVAAHQCAAAACPWRRVCISILDRRDDDAARVLQGDAPAVARVATAGPQDVLLQ